MPRRSAGNCNQAKTLGKNVTPFKDKIKRWPRPYDPARGREVAAIFAGEDASLLALIDGAAGSSPFLASVIAAQAEWLNGAFADLDMALGELMDDLSAATMRQAKARIAALTALADLGGIWSLEEVTATLSTFADRATAAAFRVALGEAVERRQLPETATMCIFAMGKWGANELNYSSDIDLICMFDHTIYGDDVVGDIRAGLVKVTRRMTALLSDVTDQGYVFRTDLRLRPDAAVTPVCMPMATAMHYYESVGRTWERAAWIKARAAAGDLQAGEAFLNDLKPFIWRKHLDFAAIADAHDIRQRIREHRALNGPVVLEGHNLKLGKGGIREIEFFAQTRQLISGGRDPGLRQRDTVGALAALATKGWVPGETADVLTADYRAHREVEHRLQMINDAQTHDLPQTDDGFARLAALMGTEVATLRDELTERIARVASLTETFFDPGTKAAVPERSERMRDIMGRWRTYPAFRTDRAVELYKRFEPQLIAGLTRAADPDAALLRLDTFLAALPAGVQLFSLFSANPNLIDLIVDICAASPALAAYLGHNAAVLDAVIDGNFFQPVPEVAVLLDQFRRRLAGLDYEAALIALRQLRADWHFRIGVHHLRGLISPEEAGRAYVRLAEGVLQALLPVVIGNLETRHGPMPGQGVALLGMGSLGAGWLTANSDLDLILIYDAPGNDLSNGPGSLTVREWFHRLTQTFITALSAQMAGGRLYETDMRLRPSGRKGAVATSLSGFRDYQLNEAWVWEHMALSRARIIASDGPMHARLDEVLMLVLGQKRPRAAVIEALADMRRRLLDAKGDVPAWDVKAGPGGLTDIELLAAAGELLAPGGQQATRAQLQDAVAAQVVASDAGLAEAWTLQQNLRTTMALLSDKPIDPSTLGGTGPALLARDTGIPQADLMDELERVRLRAAEQIAAALASS